MKLSKKYSDYRNLILKRLKEPIKMILTVGSYLFMQKRVRDAMEKLLNTKKVDAVHIETTNICNAACVFCAYPVMERPQKVMEMEFFKKIVDKGLAAGMKRFDLTPTVGDPFADKHIFERLEYLARSGAAKVGFTTNAIAFSQDKIDKLYKFQSEWPRLKIPITVSLGGFDRDTYLEIFKVDKFKAVSSNILYLLDTSEKNGMLLGKINIRAKCPPERGNGPFFENVYSFKERGICSLWVGENDYGNWGGKIDTEELKKMGFQVAKPPKRFWGPCHLMFFHGVIVSAEGNVNACACRDVELTLPIGNIGGDRSLQDVMGGQERRELIQNFFDGRIPETCKSCSDYRSVFDPTTSFFKKNVGKIYD